MDTIGNMLTTIRNGYLTRKDLVTIPHSKIKEALARKLMDIGFLDEVSVDKKDPQKDLVLKLKYSGMEPALSQVRRVSKPGLRIYKQKKNLKPVLGGLGYTLISTPKGVLTNKEARKQGLGGEIICEVW